MRISRARGAGYANVMATLALFVALGGTGVAAVTLRNGSVTSAKLARGAVTAAKLAKGAVTADKIRTGSLVASAFAPGQLPSGPSPAGPGGPQGAAGVRGPAGADGADGLSEAIVDVRPSTPLTTVSEIGKVTLPLGDYVVLAKVTLVNSSAVPVRVSCDAGSVVGFADSATTQLEAVGGADTQTLTLLGVARSTSGPMSARCYPVAAVNLQGTDVTIRDARLVAVAVDEVR